MYLKSLIKVTKQEYRNIPIKGISFDSRKAKKNDIFFAIKGNKTTASKYINEAISKRVAIIIYDKSLRLGNLKYRTLKVHNTRESLSQACSNFFKKKPSKIIAVTGTNGKSSVADFFFQILNLNKISVASIGTLGVITKNYIKKNYLTSPDPLNLHKILFFLSKRKINNVIIEASSHGIIQKRLNYLKFKSGIFTNLSHDHLDYHKNMKTYLESKLYLFKKLLNKNSSVITDTRNKEFNLLKKIATKRKLKILALNNSKKGIKIINIENYKNFQIVKVKVNSNIFTFKFSLIGYFQLKNLLMAVLAAHECGLSFKKIFKVIGNIKPVNGRLMPVAYLNNNSKILVDYAHTPDALEQTLKTLKNHFNKNIIIVFGCGGERDKYKRFKMGKIAKKYCKKIYITDDNPRNENPKLIRKDILRACKGSATSIGNRKIAIKTSIENLDSNEILLVAGRGHETIQDYGKKIKKFSDAKVIKEIVNEKKINYKKNNYHQRLLLNTFKISKLINFKFKDVSINSKKTGKGTLFFSIKGENTDGHFFVKDAIINGATKAVVSKKIKGVSNFKLIKVKNTLSSLNKLAAETRLETQAKIIGITGSAGKTTLKNLTSFALKNYGLTHHSPRSYNNKYGVPISLTNLKQNTQYGVFELGMNKKGEIDNLSKLLKPEIAVITNISEAHIKNFKNIREIAMAKSEIIKNTSKNGILILNRDDRFFNLFKKIAKKKLIKVLTFGKKRGSDVLFKSIKKHKKQYKLKVELQGKIFYFDIKYNLKNFIQNILACIAVLYSLRLNLQKMKKKFINFRIPSGRGDVNIIKKYNKNFTLIDESYNANPLSMISAIKNLHGLKKLKNQRKIFFMGDMLELGKKSKKIHKFLPKQINKTDIDKVFVYGKYSREVFNSLKNEKKGKVFNTLDEANNFFSKFIGNKDIFMIKGSNATGLHNFSKNLKKGQINAL